MGLCSSTILPEKETMSREEKLKYVFRHLDGDGNGVVTIHEMMSTAVHLNAAERTAVLHQFEQIDRNGDEAIDEKEYGQAMLNAYKQTSDHDFDTWVENMLHTKQWDKGALQEAGVEWHSKSFHGTNDDDGPRVDNVALDHEAHLEENKRRRLTAKLKGVENWGEKLGFTSDHHHYHAPEYEPPIAPVKYKHAHCDATAATKIQTHVRGKIAKKKTSEKKARRDSELKAAKTKKPHSHNHHHHHHDS